MKIILGPQSAQDVEDASKVGQQPLNQTVGNEVNQTAEEEEEEGTGEQIGQPEFRVDVG
jgi:hypothetical protein